MDELAGLLKKLHGKVLSENLALLMAAGKPVLYEPYEFTQLSYVGAWDETKITGPIRRREFSAIILNTNIHIIGQSGRFTHNFILSMRHNYRLLGAKYGHIFYVPK